MTIAARTPTQRQPDPAVRWEIVTRAQAGDPNAFADLYRLYQPNVYGVVYRRTNGNRTLSEDLTQDVFLRAIRAIGSVSWQGRDPGAWLVTIARNIVVDHYKSGRVRYESMYGDAAPEAVDHDRRGDPEQVAVHNAFSPVLDAALAQLTPDQRRVLALRFGAGLSTAETAAAMGKNEGAVKAAQYRACQAMARLLNEAASC